MRHRPRITLSGPKQTPVAAAPEKTCQHRGGEVRTMRSDICGTRGQMIPVYACGVHGECTHRQVCHGQDPSVKICLGCEDGPWPL